MSETKDNNWLNKIKDLLGDSPKDKDDLVNLLYTAVENRLITQDIFQMILGVFSVSEIPVREIMIPRPYMITIDVNEELNSVISKVIDSGHSRFPVINQKPDEILGILHAKDLLKNQIISSDDFDLHDYIRPAKFIPESKRLNILLNEFKASRNHIAIVIDEHSNISGLVTLEDLIEEINIHKSEYLYLTSNETIEGIQLKNFNNFNKKLIIDMSSDICSYKFDWDNISFIYAGAQKNLGIPGVTICILENNFIEENNLTSYLNAKNHINKNSAFNTPPTFSIYVMLNILNWINVNGGIEQIEENNISKANKIYRLIDENLEKLIPLAPKDLRSTSNIVFDFKDKNKTEQFLKQSSENGFLGLNGHRSIGGVRISNYNSISQEMVSNLLEFIQKFLSSY